MWRVHWLAKESRTVCRPTETVRSGGTMLVSTVVPKMGNLPNMAYVASGESRHKGMRLLFYSFD